MLQSMRFLILFFELENLISYFLLEFTTSLIIFFCRFALITLAKHHAISYAMIQEEGGAEKFFKRFPNLDYEGFDKPQFIDMMQPICTNSLNLNLKILKVINNLTSFFVNVTL